MGACLLTQDPFKILRPLLNDVDNTSSSLKKLRLPDEWKGINGAVNYLRVLDEDKAKKKMLDLMAKHITQILFYLNYESLRKKGEPNVVTRILDAYHDDPNKSKLKEVRQKNFHTYHLWLGRWWWRLAAWLGLSILLVADDVAINIYVA